MSLSISQRLTITSAFLTALVLFPAGFAIHESVERIIELKASRLALEAARNAAETILKQWDEEFLVEFAGESICWDLKMHLPDWAVVRPNGRVEWASGAFSRNIKPEATGRSDRIATDGERPLRVASVLLIDTTTLAFEELPGPVERELALKAANARFLTARREIAGSSAAFEVKMLAGDRILELKLTSEGEILGRRVEDLPKSLPPDLVSHLRDGAEQYVAEPPKWTAYEGQLLAIIKLTSPWGAWRETAVNRIGERFFLSEGSEVAGRDQASRVHVTVCVDASGERDDNRALHGALWMGGGLAWCLLVLTGWFVARRAMAPVRDIVSAVRKIGVPRLSERLPVPKSNDELSRIAETINAMLERIEAGYRRERQFTGDASHELRTPLAKVIAEIDLALSRERDSDDYRESLERCRSHAASMQRVVEALLLLARFDNEAARPPLEAIDMGTLAAETVAASREARDRVQLRLEETRDPMMAVGERNLLGILIRNLVENALHYSPPAKPVLVEVSREGDRVITKIVDEGPGIPEEARERVFDPFVRLDLSRSKETGGIGLGLSIARAIARVHGTSIDLRQGPRGGTAASFALFARTGGPEH